MIRLGVIGHHGYEELPAVLAELTDAAARFGIEPYFEKDLLPLVPGGKGLEKPASIDARSSVARGSSSALRAQSRRSASRWGIGSVGVMPAPGHCRPACKG